MRVSYQPNKPWFLEIARLPSDSFRMVEWGGASKGVDGGYEPSSKRLTSKEDGYFWSEYYTYGEIFLSLINRTLLTNLRRPAVSH